MKDIDCVVVLVLGILRRPQVEGSVVMVLLFGLVQSLLYLGFEPIEGFTVEGSRGLILSAPPCVGDEGTSLPSVALGVDVHIHGSVLFQSVSSLLARHSHKVRSLPALYKFLFHALFLLIETLCELFKELARLLLLLDYVVEAICDGVQFDYVFVDYLLLLLWAVL